MLESISPAVIWLTGLSGSGKSTIAEKLVSELNARHLKVEYLDGDKLRAIFPNTGFTKEARNEHVRRVGFMASRLEHHGIIVVASFISPYIEARDFVRNLCKRFVEVHVSTPLEVCERRDVKGLYVKARNGELSHFTGISDIYEEPLEPNLRIDTSQTGVEECVNRILMHLLNDSV